MSNVEFQSQTPATAPAGTRLAGAYNPAGEFSQQVELATNDTGRDAWGRPKVIHDFSLFSGIWTLSVPNRVWLQDNDTGSGFVEQTQIDNNLVKSLNGYLQITGNTTTDVMLRSKRHLRYQANRGLLYSTAAILPAPNIEGVRRFGMFTEENGVFFELVGTGFNWSLFVVRRTTENGTTSDNRIDITSNLPDGFDPSKGHVYDIQMEWRGVGNFYIYIDLTLTYTFALLGTLTGMSISNPALSVSWEVSGVGDGTAKILAGCVDVTSEGGYRENKLYSSVSTGTALLTTNNTGVGILAVRIPETVIYNGGSVINTRDVLLTAVSSFCKDEAFKSIYVSRYSIATNLAALTGWVAANDTLTEYRTNSDGNLDTAFQADKSNMVILFSIRNEKDFSTEKTNPDPISTDFHLTQGDILVLELKSDGNSTGGATIEMSEEV